MNVGFVGIGHMGEPMVRNLLRTGIPVTVWNRSPEKCEALVDIGAQRATSLQDVFKRSTVVMLMLLNSQVIDAVLRRRTPGFAALVCGRVIVQLGTTSPDYSRELEFDIIAAGGTYVEAPVSGSRQPAERGELIGMIAGHADAVDRVLPLLEPLCARVFSCGRVPGALRMKLAANHYLIGMVTVLAETVHAARSANVDLDILRQVLDAGPMASTISRTKLDKLIARDFSPQAAIRDVSTIADLVLAQCEESGPDTPLIRQCAALYRRGLVAGHGDEDMAAVVHAFSSTHSRRAQHPRHGHPMSNRPLPASIDAAAVASRSVRTVYPEPFATLFAGRDKKALGNFFGLVNFGVNLSRLAPGAISALRHAHSRQDEFVYILEGHPTLHMDEGATQLAPGMCAGFRAGTGNAHRLANDSDRDVLYLEIGDRTAGDEASYPDDDLIARETAGAWTFLHKDGRPY